MKLLGWFGAAALVLAPLAGATPAAAERGWHHGYGAPRYGYAGRYRHGGYGAYRYGRPRYGYGRGRYGYRGRYRYHRPRGGYRHY